MILPERDTLPFVNQNSGLELFLEHLCLRSWRNRTGRGDPSGALMVVVVRALASRLPVSMMQIRRRRRSSLAEEVVAVVLVVQARAQGAERRASIAGFRKITAWDLIVGYSYSVDS